MIRRLGLLLGFVLLGASDVVAQEPQVIAISGDSALVVAGARYEMDGLTRAFVGGGYRDLWITPISVPVADLSTLAGGLTPLRVGGGMTTRTLHLLDPDGQRYVFRSVDKIPVDLLQEFEGTPLEAVLQDQMSSFHPSGAVIVARLLDEVGVLHPNPRLVVVPDDPRLGEFREEFGGMLALFEERPDDPPEGQQGFGGSAEVVQTDRLFELLEADPGHRVAIDELLRGRLIDLLVGDRDRSTNNHLWGRFDDEGGGYVWRPIPRDRDQAFVQFDGFLKGLGRRYEPRLVFFGDEYPSVQGLTRNAWDIDRTLLVGLDRAEWLEIVDGVKTSITDEVIDAAVRRMPEEHYSVVGPELDRQLRRRRDGLDRAAEELYRIVFEYADIHVTDEDEIATVDRLSNGGLSVEIRPSSRPARNPTFERTFEPQETKEVRLYLHGGDDRIVVRGGGPGSIKLRAAGGGGRDVFVDSSATGGSSNAFYDGGESTEVVRGPGTSFKRRNAPRPFSWHEEERTLDWGSVWAPEPRIGYDADRGLFVGAGVTVTRHAFLKYPYSTETSLRAGWSFGRSEPLLDYQQFWRDALGDVDVRIHARWSGMEILHYYGLGNEVATAGPLDFHKIDHREMLVSAMLSIGDGGNKHVGVGPVLAYTSTDTLDTETILETARPYGSGTFTQLGVQAEFEVDGRDAMGTPSSGYRLFGGARYFPEAFDLDRGAFGAVHGDLAVYLSPSSGNPTLAVRAGAKKVWGAFPFSEAAYLGGAGNVRGVREQRFSGSASAFVGGEIRIHVARFLFIVPTDFGVFGLADVGRVFNSGETSSLWHQGYGGGIWLAPLRRSSTIQLSMARSAGRNAWYLGVGFAF